MKHCDPAQREDMVRVCRLMYEKGRVAANDGYVSLRIDEHRLHCTPTALSKRRPSAGPCRSGKAFRGAGTL